MVLTIIQINGIDEFVPYIYHVFIKFDDVMLLGFFNVLLSIRFVLILFKSRAFTVNSCFMSH